VWDARKFLERIGGDEQLLHEVTEIFLDETPKLLARLQEAINSGDAGLVERTAHSLKGELSYFGFDASHQARELERMGREKQLGPAAVLLAAFRDAVANLMNEVRGNVRGRGAHGGS